MARSLPLALVVLVALVGWRTPVAANPAATSQNARKWPMAAISRPAQVVVDDFGNMQFLDGAGMPLVDAQGQPVRASPIGLDYGFQGRRHDPETGLLYFRARMYDPVTGRFIQLDPVWDPVNAGNSYTFVGNNPVNYTDPTGEIAWVPLIWGAAKLAAWGGLIGGASLGAADTYAQYQTTAGFTAGDWNAGETAGIAGRGALVGAAGGFTFGLAAPAGAGALGYFGASSGWAAFGGAVLGGSAAGGVEGGVSWGLGLSGGSLAENVGRGALLGGLTGGVFHGAGNGAGRLGGPVHNWLRAGPSGGLRRNALAWHMNRFRLNSTRFYSVLSDKAADRLRAGGEPWPTGVSRANLGEGFYAWARRADAQGYLNLRSQAAGFDPSHGTSVRAFRIHNKTLAGLRRMDLTKVDGDAFQHFIDHHTMYADNFMPHGFEYVIYPRAIGVEHFFDKSVFHHFMGR